MSKKILIGFAVLVLTVLTFGFVTPKDVSGYWNEQPILVEYCSNGNYKYLINPITDVVYIKYDEWGIGGRFWDLVPLYKLDGTLMTGKELKEAINLEEEVVIYQ